VNSGSKKLGQLGLETRKMFHSVLAFSPVAFHLRGARLTETYEDIHDSVLFGPSPPRPASKPKTYNGSCHCGEIEWTAKLSKAEHVLCHCQTCRKLGGGPYSLNAIIASVRSSNNSYPSLYSTSLIFLFMSLGANFEITGGSSHPKRLPESIYL
jgi:hypothetical protein